MSVNVPEKLGAILKPDLHRGEELMYVLCNKVGDQALVLTNRRFLSVRHGSVQADILLKDIIMVDVTTVRVPGRRWGEDVPGFEMRVRGEQQTISIVSDPLEMGRPIVESFTRFPRKLCKVIRKPFAPFKLLPAEGLEEGFVLDFFGGNLQERTIRCPLKCAGCQEPVSRHVLDEIHITWGGVGILVPYCPACFNARFGPLTKQRAVKPLPRLVEMRDRIWFERLGYAREFAELNLGELASPKTRQLNKLKTDF